MMFKRILIANRGEIACRVIRTARRLGVATVAVYSDADAGARHVRLADAAVRIGPPPARESYLVGERILAAARATGAEAIHPGYGFLSENAEFAVACERAGVVFIGPPPEAIRKMGSKSAAKALMSAAGVPVTPGYHGEDQDPARLADEAARIGYPVLIKATAGGGGKGMRRVDGASDFGAALASCRREAAGAFGDDRVLVEKYLLSPRHIEIQVFGDRHGEIVHLFERDCSVQRRHQKVLEEAPAPGLDPTRRAAMGAAAVAAAKAVGYVGAGTVEFIAAPDGTFYFMEMNTRLQVEHPVTEMITGLDLVEWQLRVAAGEPLPRHQEQLRFEGHAIEARIYAEDPDRGFLPSTGTLTHLVTPPASAQLRIDTGVEAGDAITPFYDPMIAKLIVHGTDRAEALARLRQALSGYRIVGVANNVDFLGRLVATPSFSSGAIDTGLIEREHDHLLPGEQAVPEEAWLLVGLAEVLRREVLAPETGGAWQVADGWRLNARPESTVVLRAGARTRAVVVARVGAGRYELALDQQVEAMLVSATLSAGGELVAELRAQRHRATVICAGERRHLFTDGRSWTLLHVDPVEAADDEDDPTGGLRAPMPGKIVALLAPLGERVERGAPLLVLEAMKMEHTIHAPAAGVVRRFRFAAGDQVGDGAELVEFEAETERKRDEKQ